MAKQQRKCLTPTCENSATARTNYCLNCGANINGWFRRRPAERLERKRKLTLYGSRIDIVLDGKPRSK